MVTRIVHISDLHYPSLSRPVADALLEAIVAAEPTFLVITGDIANHPSARYWMGKGAWIDARVWLQGLIARVPGVQTLTLPGNHDVLFTGLSGWCWPPTAMFRQAFREWIPPLVAFHADANLTFLTLDSNPLIAVASAEGKVLSRRLRALKREMEHHRQAAAIRDSTKILLMHHHPLPVPFERDWLLHTRRVDRLLRFIAEQRIDMVLHGHKHRASWSHVRLGGASAEPLFIEALGAGSAFKDGDCDPRGHNFNIVDVSNGGVRHVRQYFRRFDATRFVEQAHSAAEDEVDRLVQARFRQPYRAETLTWSLAVDSEGDGVNTMSYEGLVFNRNLDSYELDLFDEVVENADVQPYSRLHISPAELGGSLEQTSGSSVVKFSRRPREDMNVRVDVENVTHNGYALNQRDAIERGLSSAGRDSMELLLSDPVQELRLEATFPEGFTFADVRLEVLEHLLTRELVHETSTSASATVPQSHRNTLTAHLKLPLPNFRYRLSWALPKAEATPPLAEGRRDRFEAKYLKLVAKDGLAEPAAKRLDEAILFVIDELEDELDRLAVARLKLSLSARAFEDDELDFSIMVRERSSGQRPSLRLVDRNQESQYKDVFRELRLGIGEGNAGRAYKARVLRLWDEDRARLDPRFNTLKWREKGPHYTAVLSLPILDTTKLPLAVVNAGVVTEIGAQKLRLLEEQDLIELASRLHKSALERLLQAAEIERIMST